MNSTVPREHKNSTIWGPPVYIFPFQGLVLAIPTKGGDKIAGGFDKVGDGIDNGIDSLASAVGATKNTSVGGIVDGLSDIVGGVFNTAGDVVNKTVEVSKSQKNFFLSSN